MSVWQNLKEIAGKELRVFAADRSGALLTILLPVLLAALTGLLFGPSEDKAITLLVSHAGGPRAEKLVAALEATDGLTVEVTEAAAGQDRVARGKASALVILPPEIEQALAPTAFLSEAQTTIRMLRDPARAIEAQFTQGILFRVLMEQLAQAMTDPKELRVLLKAQRAQSSLVWIPFLDAADSLVARLEAEQAAQPPDSKEESPGIRLPIKLSVEQAKDESLPEVGGSADSGYHSYAHTFAGMLCMFLLFMAQGQAKRLVEERQEGTLTRLRMTPVPRWTLLVGMGLATMVIALGISVAVYGVGMVVFGIPVRGSVVGFVLVILAQAAAVGGFALLLAGLGRTSRQIENLSTFAILVMSFAGGGWVPSFLMPSWLATIGLALPTRWATDGLAAMTWRGLGFMEGAIPALVLLAFAGVTAFIGVRRFRWV